MSEIMLIVRYAMLEKLEEYPTENFVCQKMIDGTSPSGHRAYGWIEYKGFLTPEVEEKYKLEYLTCERYEVFTEAERNELISEIIGREKGNLKTEIEAIHGSKD